MKMRQHEAVRNYSHPEFGPRRFHHFEVAFMILVTLEQHALSRTSIARVIHVSTLSEPSLPCHGPNRYRNRITRFLSRPVISRGSRWGQTPRRAETRRKEP